MAATVKGADYAWRAPNHTLEQLAAALHKAGFAFVVRYISHDTSKNLSVAEIAALRKYGIRIVTVFESTADRALAGGAAGVQDATFARTYLRSLRAPSGHAAAPVYFAIDFDMQPSQVGQCMAYLRGASQVLGRASTGVYGGLAAVKDFASVTGYQWQTVAWSHSQWFAGDEMKQFAAGGTILGTAWDLDTSSVADFGQWKFPGDPVVTVPPPPAPPSVAWAGTTEETSMLIPAGNGRKTPLAIPIGTKRLHLVSAEPVSVAVTMHGSDAVGKDLTWASGSAWFNVPKNCYAGLIERTDASTTDLSLTYENE
jgi:hypothetical protein